MEWTKRNGIWRSGPYTIELLAPEKWVLSREAEEDETSQVETGDMQVHVDDWWTGRSLRAMKRKAESIEASENRRRDRNRNLAIMFSAILLFVLVAGSSGPIAATLAIVSAGVAIYGMVRSFDNAVDWRPWDRLNENFQ